MGSSCCSLAAKNYVRSHTWSSCATKKLTLDKVPGAEWVTGPSRGPAKPSPQPPCTAPKPISTWRASVPFCHPFASSLISSSHMLETLDRVSLGRQWPYARRNCRPEKTINLPYPEIKGDYSTAITSPAAKLIPHPVPIAPETHVACLRAALPMIEMPAAGISQDLVGLQLPRTGETGLMGGFLFELAVVEEHKGSPSALSPDKYSYATFLFLALLQGHSKVKLRNRSCDGISFPYPLPKSTLPKICSALLTTDDIRKHKHPA